MPKLPRIRRLILAILWTALLVTPGASAEKGSAAPAQAYAVFIPLLASNSPPPCGAIPFLISPADGSQATPETLLVLDGGYRGGDFDWLGYEFSRTSDFSSKRGGYLQPAGKHWELELWTYNLEPGQWYWRASLWCNGPGWPPPPVGYEQGLYSEAWSFTLMD